MFCLFFFFEAWHCKPVYNFPLSLNFIQWYRERNPIPQIVYLIIIKFIQVNSLLKMIEIKDLEEHL